MASRSVVARLAIDGVDGVVAGFRRAREAAKEYEKVSLSSGQQHWGYIKKHAAQLDAIGTKLVKLGSAGALALGGLAAAAVSWERDWTGVTKTVDGSSEQMQRLEGDLRQMAKSLPASHREIAAVAEAAGQLGVGVDDVAAFTRVMIDLGETTNMSALDAATTLQRFMNVMGTSQKDVSKLGSTIVGLGNNFATTESEIATMAQRIAGVGRQMGMSEAQVLGMAAAMSSVGIEAEAGGTSISLVMKKIDGSVREGGRSLDGWARVAKMSSADFKKAWETDAAGALVAVTEGLGGVIASGGSAAQVLTGLGVTGIRETDTMNRLALATKSVGNESGMLSDALKLASVAWSENNALQREAEKRYETRQAKSQIALNSIKDEAITLGQRLLPAVDTALSAVTDLTEAFAGLPSGVKESVIGIAATGTAAALAAGGLLKAVTAAANLKAGLIAVGVSARGATLALGAIGAALTLAGVVVGGWMGQQGEAAEKTREFSDAIRQQGVIIGETTRMIAGRNIQNSGLYDLAQKAGVGLSDLTDAALGSESALDRVKAALDGSREALEAKVAANQAEMDSLDKLTVRAADHEVQYTALQNANAELNSELSNRVSLNDKVLTSLAEESAVVAESARKAEQLKEATQGAEEAAKANTEKQRAQSAAYHAVTEDLQALVKETQAYGNELLQLSGSQISVESAISDLADVLIDATGGMRNGKKVAAGFTESQIKAGKALDITSAAGRKNQQSLDALAKSSMSYVSTLVEQGATEDQITAATARARSEWESAARQLGMTESKVQQLSKAYFGIPKVASTQVSAPGADEAARRVQSVRNAISGLPAETQSKIKAMLDRGDVAAAERELERLSRDRDIALRVRTKVLSAPTMGATVASADGNILDYYAHGGIRERHVAHIAPAGAWRVFAEPETGGEAYIPLAPSKRPRSEALLREVARRFGMHVLADGAVISAAASSRSAPVTSVAAAPVYLTISPGQLAEIKAVVRAGSAEGTAAGVVARDATTARTIGRLR